MATKEVHVLQLVGDASSLRKALKDVDDQLEQVTVQADRTAAALGPGLGKAQDRVVTGATRAARATRQLTEEQRKQLKAGRQARANLQNVSFQLQDIAVQYEMGTHWSRIFAQQGTQILGVFGPMATLLGALAAGFIALAPAVFRANAELEALLATLESAQKAVDDYRTASGLLNSELGESAGGFDMVTASVQGLFEAEQELQDMQARMAVDQAFGATDEALENSQRMLGLLDHTRDRIAQIGFAQEQAFGGDRLQRQFTTQLKALNRQLVDVERKFEQIAEGMGLTGGALEAYLTQWRNFDSGGTLESQIDSVEQMLELMRQNVPTNQAMLASYIQQRAALQQTLRVLLSRKDVEDAIARDAERTAASFERYSEASREMAVRFADDATVMSQAVEATDASIARAVENFRRLVEQQEQARKAGEATKVAIESGATAVRNSVGVMQSLATNTATVATNAWNWAAGVWSIVRANAAAGGNAPAETGGRGGDPRAFDGRLQFRQQLQAQADWEPPKGSTGGGGASGAPSEDALERFLREYELKVDLLKVDEDRKVVIEALGDEVDKYTDKQIDSAVAVVEAYRQQQEAIEAQQEAVDIINRNLEDGFMSMIDGTKSVKDAFKDMARSIINELFRVLVLQRLIGSFGSGSGLLGSLGNIFGSADGNVFQNGAIVPYANGGVVSKPTLFPMSSGNVGLMGEAGPEAIMPLSRDSGGRLGVSGPGITVNNYSGHEVTVDRSQEMITIAVGQARQAVQQDFAQSMSTGQGIYSRAVESNYGSRRKLG